MLDCTCIIYRRWREGAYRLVMGVPSACITTVDTGLRIASAALRFESLRNY